MNKKMLKMLALMLVMIMAFTACSSTPKVVEEEEAVVVEEETPAADTEEESEPVVIEQKITYALHNNYDIIDPGITNNSFTSVILTNVFEGLVTYDQDNNIVGGMAESWEISEDGTVYTFDIRDDLKWSNGEKLDANDFVYSYLRVLDPATGGKYAGMLTDYIAGAEAYYAGEVSVDELGIKAIDDNTLELTLKTPTPYYMSILCMWVYSPVNEATITANPDWTLDASTYVSNGPFKISEIKFGEVVVLAKNENYHNADSVNLEEIRLQFIPDQSTALVAFEKGEIDGQQSIPPADLPRLKAESDSLQVTSSYASTYYEINTTRAPFDDPKVRNALALAIDRTAIIENVLQSTDTPAYALVSPGYVVDGVDYTDGRSTYGLSPTADVEAAQALLAEAGYPNGEGFPEIEISYYTNETVKKVVEAMQQMLKDNLNIEVKVGSEEWAVYYEGIQNLDYDIGAMGWGADYLHPMTYFPLRKTGTAYNNTGYSNLEYDALVDLAQAEVDPIKAMAIMREAEDMLMADMPLIPLYYRSNMFMMDSEITGYNMTPLSQLYFKDAKVGE